MKTTKQYVGQFRLDQENFQFNREEFLAMLNQEFLGKIGVLQLGVITYPKFRNCVKEIETKFWAISNKKVGQPFSDKLWSAFFAVYVIKVRAELFPDIEKSITEKREQHIARREATMTT